MCSIRCTCAATWTARRCAHHHDCDNPSATSRCIGVRSSTWARTQRQPRTRNRRASSAWVRASAPSSRRGSAVGYVLRSWGPSWAAAGRSPTGRQADLAARSCGAAAARPRARRLRGAPRWPRRCR
eukprot:scaffold2090_cov225-Prasinococcus_capsulatus_cf.AAC.27